MSSCGKVMGVAGLVYLNLLTAFHKGLNGDTGPERGRVRQVFRPVALAFVVRHAKIMRQVFLRVADASRITARTLRLRVGHTVRAVGQQGDFAGGVGVGGFLRGATAPNHCGGAAGAVLVASHAAIRGALLWRYVRFAGGGVCPCAVIFRPAGKEHIGAVSALLVSNGGNPCGAACHSGSAHVKLSGQPVGHTQGRRQGSSPAASSPLPRALEYVCAVCCRLMMSRPA